MMIHYNDCAARQSGGILRQQADKKTIHFIRSEPFEAKQND
jgi:hypothetical protein